MARNKLELTANEATILSFVQNYPNSSENIEKLLADASEEFTKLARKAIEEARFKIADRGAGVSKTKVCRCRCGNIHREL